MSSGGPHKVTPHPDIDAGKFSKLALRVEKVLKEQVLFHEPKQLRNREVLVAPYNRDGAPPNVQYIHNTLLKGFVTKGFDRTRPQVGICIKYSSPEGKKKLIEHNKRFSQGQTLLPPIHESEAMYGSLAGSHLTIAGRIIEAGMASPAGDLTSLLAEQESLREFVANGHKWWVLPEDLPKSSQLDISMWRNQDQNENHGTHEIEILQTVVATALDLGETTKKIPLGDLVAKALKRNPSKISARVIQNMAKFFVQFLQSNDQHLVNELIDFHSSSINPRELVVSNLYYEALVTTAELETTPCLRHYLLLCQYTTDKVRQQAGGASVGAFVETSSIVALCKKQELLKTVELQLKQVRDKYLPLLEETLSPKEARLELAVYCDWIIRCLMARPWSEERKPGKVTGKYSVEKIKALGVEWAKYIDKQHAELNFAVKADLIPEKDDDEEDEDSLVVDLEGIRTLKRNHSDDAPPVIGSAFQRGDQVTVIRRMSWHFPEVSKTFRKDLVEGLEGVIAGFADSEKVLLQVTLELKKGKPQECVQPCYSRNLVLTNNYKVDKAAGSKASNEEEEQGTSKSKTSGKASVPQWLLGESNPEDVKQETGWTKLLSDFENINKIFWLKARIGVHLQALSESVPSYTASDLVVCHRQTSSKTGVYKDELWTKRAFKPLELVLAPLVSQIKDTHLTNLFNVPIGLPKVGRGAHPESQALALDARGKTQVAKKGVIDDHEHHGNLFWLVQRTSEASLANMSLESVSAEHELTLHMPFKKKKVDVHWSQQEMPTIPILVNKKAIKEHTQLFVYVPGNSK